MKNNHFLLLVLLISYSTVFSQIRIGDFESAKYGFSKLNEKDLERFKLSKTIFFFTDQFTLEEYDKILKENWTVTPYIIKDISEFKNYKFKAGESYFRPTNYTISLSKGQVQSSSYLFFNNVLNLIDDVKINKKGKRKMSITKISDIYFTGDINARMSAFLNAENTKGSMVNYKLGYLKNFFQNISNTLVEGRSVEIYDDLATVELKRLKTDTLYIDKSVILGFDKITNKKLLKMLEKRNALENIDAIITNLSENYPYPFKIVSTEELNDKILNTNVDFYYLMNNQLNSNKVITVFNGKTSDIIYNNHSKMSYKIKSKDLKRIVTKIEKL